MKYSSTILVASLLASGFAIASATGTEVMRRSSLAPSAAITTPSKPPVTSSARSTSVSVSRPTSLATGSGQPSAASLAMIENRARTLGNRVSGSGTRYFSVRDADLTYRQTPEQVLKRLSPKLVKPDSRVRRVEVVVDLRRPLVIQVESGKAAHIGTVPVDPAVRRIEVVANIINLKKVEIVPQRNQHKAGQP